MDQSDAVSIQGVMKKFNSVTAVADLSLRIPRQAIYGLLGPNGAGKTTTLRMILRVLQPDAGEIRVLGEPVSDQTSERIGYLPEERGLYPRMEVQKILTFLGALRGLQEADAARRSLAWLERLELGAWANKKVIDLSKGMQQKVQFIAAVLHNPPLLILDEPFTGLDPVNAAIIKDIMLEQRRNGSTIILSTHRMEQVEMMCDSICLIDHGEKVLDGDLKAIKRGYGKNTVRIEYEGDGDFLQLPEVIEKINQHGAVVEVRLRPGGDPQEILKSAVARGARITRFELVEPPLNDIFIEKVSQKRDETVDHH